MYVFERKSWAMGRGDVVDLFCALEPPSCSTSPACHLDRRPLRQLARPPPPPPPRLSAGSPRIWLASRHPSSPMRSRYRPCKLVATAAARLEIGKFLWLACSSGLFGKLETGGRAGYYRCIDFEGWVLEYPSGPSQRCRCCCGSGWLSSNAEKMFRSIPSTVRVPL